MKKHTINIVMGDWANDGHGRTETVTITCNLTGAELQAAYRKGCKIVGFDFSEVAARHFEDNSIAEEYVDVLEQAGMDLKEYGSEWGNEDDRFALGTDNFWMVWLFVAGLGDPSLKYEVVVDSSSRVYVAGYGLFHN